MNEISKMHEEKILAFISEDKLEEALDYIVTIPEKERSYWEIENLTGIISCRCGMFEEAVGFFRRALKSCPNSVEIYYNLSYAYMNMEDFAQAELMLNCCEHNAKDEETLANIARMRNEIHAAYEENPELKEENNVLMVAYYFPPLAGSGVFRSIKYARYLSDYGWKPTVISTDVPPRGWSYHDNSLVDEIPEDMDVFRVPDIINKSDSITIDGKKLQEVMDYLKGVFQHDKSAIEIFQSLINEQKYNTILSFPCHALLWSLDVIRYIEENMDLGKFKTIYTTSGPFSSHLVGFYLKKKYNMPWVADYRDPWTSNPYSNFDTEQPIYKLYYCLEGILLKQADCNLTIVDALVDDYKKKFGLPADQIECITNGYDENDFAQLVERTERTEKFTITYSGLMYTQEHNINPVMYAIKQLCDEKKINRNDLRLRIIGQGHEAANKQIADQYGLGDVFEQTGYVEHKTALQANLDSDLLLILVGDATKFKYFYPGKIFEYLRSGKPIMAIASKESGVAKILSETGHGETFLSTQTENIKSYILREYEEWRSRSDNKYERSPLIEIYERRYLTMKLADVLNTAYRNPRKFNEIENNVYDEAYVKGGPAGAYHKHYTQSFYYGAWKHALRHLLFLDRDIRILEIGCGPGQFANILFDNGFVNYKGFDYASEGIELAKKNNPRHQELFFVADAFTTPEVEEECDLVICFEVLEHLQNDLGLLERIKKGTKLLISVPNFDDPYHVRYFTSANQVYDRYKDAIDIYDISTAPLTGSNILYYIVGKKK